jgi:hypothetical protein
MPKDSRIRHGGNLPFSDGVPLSGDTRYQQLTRQFWTTGNKGNMIIGESVGRLLAIDAAHSCNLNLLDLREAGWTAAQIAEAFNERFNYVVFAMANSIQPHLGHEHHLIAEVIPLLRNTIIVLGMGKQESLPYSFNAIDPATARLLKVFNEHAAVFGVRGHDTEEWLHTMKIDRARALGCPSLYVYPHHISQVRAPEGFSASSSVITAGHLHVRERTLPVLPLFRNHIVHYIMQDEVFQPKMRKSFAPDLEFYNDVTGEVDKAIVNRIFGKLQKTSLPFAGYWYFQSPELWRAFCARHDLYIGDRFHGGVAALQAGRPAVIFWTDLRVKELTEFFGVPNLSVSELRKHTLESVVEDCLSAARLEQFHATYRERFSVFQQAMEATGLSLAVSLPSTAGGGPRSPHTKPWWRRFGNSV